MLKVINKIRIIHIELIFYNKIKVKPILIIIFESNFAIKW